MGAAYAAGAWLIIEVAGTLFPLYGWSETPTRIIATILAIGFVPALVLAWVFEWTPEGLARDAGPSGDDGHPVSGGRGATRGIDRLIIVVLALAVSVFAFDRFVLDPAEDAEIAEAAREAGRSEALSSTRGDRTLAVLPFVNMSADPDNEYFADGLTDTLLHMLAQMPELAVTARTSTFTFKGRLDDIRAIADTLDVAHVLEGSVQRSGDRVRITAQLIRASDGIHLWSEVYDRTLEDIFTTQDEIATEVATALAGQLLARPDGPTTEDLSAYDLFLQGLAAQESRQYGGLELAEQRFRQSLDKDPGFHDARVALARNHIFRELTAQAPRGALLPESQALLETVLAEQPDRRIARQLSALAAFQAASYRGALEERAAALESVERALTEGFGDSFVLAYSVEPMARAGRSEEAMTLVQEGLERDPLNVNLLLGLAKLYELGGRYSEARTTLLTAARLEPENTLPVIELDRLAIAVDDPAESLRWVRKGLEINPGEPMTRFGIATRLYDMGLAESARPWHDEFMASDGPVDAKGWLEVLWLRSTGDDAAMVARLEELLTLVLTDAGTSYTFSAVVLYANRMHVLGRSEEALEFLRNLVPRFDELGVSRPSMEHRDTVIASFPLRMDVAKEDEFPALLASYLDELATNFRNWRNARYIHVPAVFWSEGLEPGREAFLAAYDGIPAVEWDWTYLIESPWLEGLRQDPEVAAKLQEIERRRAEQRQEIIALLSQPEWER